MSAFFRVLSLFLCVYNIKHIKSNDIVEFLSYTLVPDKFSGRTSEGPPQTRNIGYRWLHLSCFTDGANFTCAFLKSQEVREFMRVASVCDSLTQRRSKRDEMQPVTVGSPQSSRSSPPTTNRDNSEGRLKNIRAVFLSQAQTLISSHLPPSHPTRADTCGQQHMEVHHVCRHVGPVHSGRRALCH